MMRKMTRVGLLSTAGASAAALAIAGFALPASADSWGSSEETTATSTDVTSSIEGFQTWVHDAILASGNDTTAGNVGIDGGVINGPIVSDSLNGDVLSGNDTPVLSGNDVSAPVGSGNDTSVDAPVGSGNEVGNGTEAGNGNSSDTSVGDIGADVDDVVGDVSGEVDGLVGGFLD